ncbi:hypothetical protein P2G88_01835 [Aliiglaciecola sp. CAU 1673]|uniref:hypothetical protein n=1 Tax=Aliiglaciecola sp. CAU 1673 TaxID=3032595 RepID=UPI0023DC20C0|nr:hypothetical protein [Aliiglaciecola sp. CAU 1673]MDF2176993.1 hypothetical protein [Aliiglaciecola sp. CAU 1673]
MSKLQFEIALNDAKGASFSTRAGDPDTDFKLGSGGVRIIVHHFGNYMPFILNSRTKDWLKKAYKLTHNQAEDVYRYLLSSARADIKDSERAMNRHNLSYQRFKPHGYIEWLESQTRY